MIKFSLLCENGHEFESWFRNGAAFDQQALSGLILCPACQASQVTKAIMAPAIASRSREKPAPASFPPPPDAPANVALLDAADKELRAMIEGIRDRIFREADDVGIHFPEQARKIHYGLVPERAIYGQASFEETRALMEEGVGILPIPALPSDQN